MTTGHGILRKMLLSMNYKVLARKYRPQNFNELIGQETLVQTFKNALNQGRLAHSYLLTGIRGVGKTTTARIIAKAFNCEGNENTNPTFNICNTCKPCISITNGNCIDVLEVDAASKTGVDNIRDIIDSVMYLPNETRFKIYIIDEVHMLSPQAFNALLKTLEEPPDSSKFIFATTEIRKIPATIISRCQRFDLKRIEKKEQTTHLKNICDKEKISIDTSSLNQIAISSEGSIRDSLSILDQASALMDNKVESKKLKQMLGLQGYEKYYDLLEFCLSSNANLACEMFDDFIKSGVPPIQIASNLMEICTKSSRFCIKQIVPDELEGSEENLKKISFYGLTHLIRAWQVLIKGFEEIKNSHNEIDAGSMLIIKLCYSSKLPMPEELIKKLNSFNSKSKIIKNSQNIDFDEKKNNNNTHAKLNDTIPIEKEIIENLEKKIPNNLEEMLQLLIQSKEGLLHAQVINNVYIDSFKPGEIKLELKENCEKSLIINLSKTLKKITEIKWNIVETNSKLKQTVVDKNQNIFSEKKAEAMKDPLIQEVFEHFPNSEIIKMDKKGNNE